jgi:hypothetical protein
MDITQKTVSSKDGTTIAFEQTGKGPAIVLVGAALADRTGITKLARLLAAATMLSNSSLVKVWAFRLESSQ